MSDDLIRYEVFEFEGAIRVRALVGNEREANLQRERLRSNVEKLNVYARRNLGMELEVISISEPEFIEVRHEPLIRRQA